MSGLVSGLFDGARHAVGARVDGIRKDLDDRLEGLAARLTSMLTAMAFIIVTALFLGLAITATLAAFAVPLWASLWGVTLTAAAIGAVASYRVQRRASAASPVALEAQVDDPVVEDPASKPSPRPADG